MQLKNAFKISLVKFAGIVSHSGCKGTFFFGHFFAKQLSSFFAYPLCPPGFPALVLGIMGQLFLVLLFQPSSLKSENLFVICIQVTICVSFVKLGWEEQAELSWRMSGAHFFGSA